jgi:hypothetical protein
MSGQTPRFSLNYFDDQTPGALEDDSSKFTGEDRLTLDRLLSALEVHDHHLGGSAVEPTDVLDLDVGTDGTLEAGLEFFYVVAFVNSDGLETAAGPEVSVSTPDLLAVPGAPFGDTSTVTGNTLASGQYYYGLSALRGAEETPLSEIEIVTLVSGENTVTLTLPTLGDADHLQIWRQKDTAASWTRIGLATTTTFVDDGSVPAGVYGDPDNVPVLSNDGVSNYSITITLGPADAAALPQVTSWRIYRSETSGVYGASSLVHEVTERVDDLDPTSALMSAWIDDGDAQLTGSPKLFTQALHVAPYTIEYADTLPSATPYPDNYPIIDATHTLYVKRAGAWLALSGGSQRGVGTFTGHGAPSVTPTGAITGDLYIDLDTGDFYTL